ncbi:hypothetical protein TYRP_003269 [Tyrophagus putrescentiae]|nr:hypothetical protein TYRP_003269 [Tyrophagus putrescentiae]
MWYEALPSMIAMGACMSLIEISPFLTHYISWGCPMQRSSYGGLQDRLTVRDQRVAESHGVKKTALHMHTFGLGVLKEPVKMSGNCDNYKEAEKVFLSRMT